MMMQKNHLICIAVSFFLSSASATHHPAPVAVKGWTVVFKLFDPNMHKYLEERHIDNFFKKNDNAEFFNDITKEEMYALINTKTKKLTYEKFIRTMKDREMTTLQALQKAFPGKLVFWEKM
ncbi:uncharacterized protein LOC111052109 [Nilaparvata lugens]|uniref:uncharacterized protein LOC111052109 n=1 Tax=Nilaparvata lugens TaxID=108931 RepID=UPI00193E2303|nr:uncharacterized protein LOC111052109 [Nilaparvata lugens]